MARRFRFAWLSTGIVTVAALIAGASLADDQGVRTWRVAWYDMPPYLYQELRGDQQVLAGLDTTVVRAVAKEAGWHVEFYEVTWAQRLHEVETGQADLVAAAIALDRSAPLLRFSKPYRRARNVLYVRAGEASRIRARNGAELVALLRGSSFRIAAHRGFTYGDLELDAYLADTSARRVTLSDYETDNLTALTEGQVDGVLIDHLTGPTLALELGLAAQIEPHPLVLPTLEVAVAFSEKTTSETEVASFNAALDRLRRRGALQAIVREYVLAPTLDVALGGRWFYYLDLIGTIAFALSGVVLARKERYSAFGALVLALLPAIGGGVVRDVVVNRHPIGVLRNPDYLLAVLAVVLAGTLVLKLRDRRSMIALARGYAGTTQFLTRWLDDVLQICDSIGLAAFTVTGVRVAIEAHARPLWLWGPLLAALTAAGGGILRDTVRADLHSNTLKRSFYAEVAIIWGLALSLFLVWDVSRLHLREIQAGTVLTVAGALVTRLVLWVSKTRSPFPLGSPDRAPEAVLARADRLASEVWLEMAGAFKEVAGATRAPTLETVELIRGRAEARLKTLEATLDEAMALPLPPEVAGTFSTARKRAHVLRTIETLLRELLREPLPHTPALATLDEAMREGLATLIQAAGAAARNGSPDREAVLTITSEPAPVRSRVRARLAETVVELPEAEYGRAMQAAARFERLVLMINEEASLAMEMARTAHGQQQAPD